MSTLKKLLAVILCAVMIIIVMPMNKADAKEKYSKNTLLTTGTDNDYENYIAKYKDKPKPQKEIIVPAADYKESTANLLNVKTNRNDKYIEIGDAGEVKWEVNVEEEGLYNISIKYLPIEGKSSDIEREFYIDGKLPFDEADSIVLKRDWKDKGKVTKDNQGNDIRPSQIEAPEWQEVTLKDSEGLYQGSFQFYFSKGKHVISLNAIREPVAIQYIKLFQEEELPSYKKVSESYTDKNEKFTLPGNIKVQGENAALKSEPTLYPNYDRSSSYDEPYDYARIRMNYIGGNNWKSSGQWLEWKVNVPKNGLYKIGMRFRQNYVVGLPVTREIQIDGKVPFKEAENIGFKYDTTWQFNVLGNTNSKNQNGYLFYLTKGQHVIRMTVTLGDISNIIRTVEASSKELTQLYTKMVMITGTTPDTLRDYQLDSKIPELVSTLNKNAKILENQVDEIKKIGGTKASGDTILMTTAYQLESMAKHPDTIPKRMSNFKDNLSSIATWTLTVRDEPLDIDYFALAPKDNIFKKTKENFFQRAVYNVRSFVTSFIVDFSSLGNKYNKQQSITVWTTMGRDQANVIKTMIDDTFTPKTGIKVNLNLINNESALLYSIASKKGPDIALNVSRTLPVDYGIRNALVDLSKMPGFDTISKYYKKTAIVPYSYGGKVYGLPQTQSFPMLFYRKDILQKLGLSVPQTWDDVYRVIGKIEENNLEFCGGTSQSGVTLLQSQDLYNSMLLQNKGTYFTSNDKKCVLDSEGGINAFKQWTNLYTLYGVPMPQTYDFFNRFKTGEMPVGIYDYTLYNQLTVAAPQIKGLWGMAPIPGMPDGKGGIDRSTSGSGTANVIFKTNRSIKNSWEFMKWWVSSDTQSRFGRELEALMGAAARYNTANVEAMKNLPWPRKDYENINAAWDYVNELPIIPGSYYMSRHIDNAMRETVLQGELPRDSIMKYTKEINKEITKKREEFNLDK